jgi:hypothetical protein
MAARAASVKEVIQKKPEGLDLYARFALAGALGCSVTHGAFTPVDVYVFRAALSSIPFATLRVHYSLKAPTESRPGSNSTLRRTTVA